MDLSLSEEQQQIVDSAVTYLQEACTMPAVRIASESDSGLDTALWSGMAELGWCGVHLPEEAGGLGLGLVELALLQEQLGRRLGCVPFFDSVALAATALRELPDSALAQQLPPGWQLEVLVADGRSDDGTRERLAERAAQDARLKLIDNPDRIVSTGLNAALAAARGAVIARFDIHTEFAPDYLAECLAALARLVRSAAAAQGRAALEPIDALIN